MNNTNLLNRSFYLEKKDKTNNEMIFYKKFDVPIILNNNNYLSYFKIDGFKNWLDVFNEKLLKGDIDKNDFKIYIRQDKIDREILIPPHIFFFYNIEYIIRFMRFEFDTILREDLEYNLECYNGKMIYFKILEKDIEVCFSDEICKILSFEPKKNYNASTKKNLFHIPKIFHDNLHHIGIWTNFSFDINYGNLLSILNTESLNHAEFYSQILINSKQKTCIKFETIYEIEIKFVNLFDEKILMSSNYLNNDEICVTLCFS